MNQKVDKNETVQWNRPHTGQDENCELECANVLQCKRKEERCWIQKRERLKKNWRGMTCFLLQEQSRRNRTKK